MVAVVEGRTCALQRARAHVRWGLISLAGAPFAVGTRGEARVEGVAGRRQGRHPDPEELHTRQWLQKSAKETKDLQKAFLS